MTGVAGSLVQLRLARTAAPTAAFVQADITRLALRPGCLPPEHAATPDRQVAGPGRC